MRELVGLRSRAHRSGIDAYFDFVVGGRRYAVPVELKSTTVGSVSTARDVGPEHIEKWRSRVWLVGFYDSDGVTLKRMLALGPDDMEPWISRIERYIAPDFLLGERAAKKLGIDDLHIVCGEKSAYTLKDAQALYKRQWSKSGYLSQMDLQDGYSPQHRAPARSRGPPQMDLQDGYSPQQLLQILRLRARYLNDRGATLNNPHIPKRFFATFADKMVEVAPELGDDGLRQRVERSVREITMGSAKLRAVAATAAGER